MRLILFNENRMTKLILPAKVDGSFWLIDELNNDTNIINIDAINNKWVIKSNDEARIINNNSYVETLELIEGMYFFVEYNNKQMFLYVENLFDKTFKTYKINYGVYSIGKSNNCDIVYDNLYVYDNYLVLKFDQSGWTASITQNSNIYINNSLMSIYNKKLNHGDSIFILGLRIIVCNGMIFINNPLNKVSLNSSKFFAYDFSQNLGNKNDFPDSESIKEVDYYTDDDYFFKKPRLRRFIEEYDLTLTPPPKKAAKQEMPLLLTIGPALTMGVVSLITFANVFVNMFSGKKDITQMIPTIITSAATLLSSLLWPNLTRRYQKRLEKGKKKKEKNCMVNIWKKREKKFTM